MPFNYYLVKDATVTAIDEPVGWDQFESVLKRSAKHGITAEFSEVQLTFYCGSGGYELLLNEYSAAGPDGSMNFRQTFDCNGVEETLYEASINFNSLVHIRGESIEVNMESVSFGSKLKTREKTKISMLATTDLDGNTITPAAPEKLNLHSRAIMKQFDAGGQDEINATASFDNAASVFVQKGWQGINIDEIEDTYHYPTGFQVTNPVTGSEYLIDVKEPGTYTFDIDISFVLGVESVALVNALLDFRWILSIDGVEHDLSNRIDNVTIPPVGWDTGTVRSTIQYSQYLNAGQKVYLFGYIETTWGGFLNDYTLNTNFDTNRINISAITTTGPSTADVWPVADVLNQIIYATTGLPNRFKSDYFANCAEYYKLTNGFSIRKFPENPLTISKEDAWQGLNPIMALGEGLAFDGSNEMVEVEPVSYFYQPNEVLKIDHPADYAEEVAGEYIYNTAEVGYEKSNTDEFNALDEFNTVRQFQTPVKTSENGFTAVSKFVASMYAIESQRRKAYKDGSKVSSAYDKDTFIISASQKEITRGIIDYGGSYIVVTGELGTINPTLEIINAGVNNGIYTVTRQTPLSGNTYIEVTPALPDPTAPAGGHAKVTLWEPERSEIFLTVGNVISPETIYNGRISPLRNALRWGSVLNSGLWFKQPYVDKMRYTAGEGNTEFTHQLQRYEDCKEGDPDRLLLSENITLDLAAFNRFKKIWKPEYITFKAPVTGAQMQLIRQAHMPDLAAAEKYGYISVWDGQEYQQGYLLELRFKDADQPDKEGNAQLSAFKLIKKWDSPIDNIPDAAVTEFSTEFSSEFR